MQLTRREQTVLQEKAQEIAASVSGEKEALLQQAALQIQQLEMSLCAKEEVRQGTPRGNERREGTGETRREMREDTGGRRGVSVIQAPDLPMIPLVTHTLHRPFSNHLSQLQELEESRRLYSAQKRALREALNAAAEREASERETVNASRTAVAQAVEDELESLQHELALTKVRSLAQPEEEEEATLEVLEGSAFGS